MPRFLFVVFLITSSLIYSQSNADEIFINKGEIYFKFEVFNKNQINYFTNIISIDNVIENTVYAYANKVGFTEFLRHKINYQILTNPGELIIAQMSDNPEEVSDWNVYPTYDAYVTTMNQFASLFPAICTIVEAGTTIQGRKILFAKISDNVAVREPEPQFMFSSSMHGDEITGYVLMLRLIDSLLTSYGSDARITNLINNIEIWINPLANPDGTYKSGNSTVTGAIRGNANYVDINRNFPDPQNGPHPDGKDWQPETLAMMNLGIANNFTLSANFHGGAEVVNYPWDTWSPLHADNNWFMFISHLYADTCQANSPSGYMSGYNDGITNGYAWYEVNGGRQDYFNYFRHCREVCIEISNTKMVAGSQLPLYWNYNRKSFLTYIENALYGIKGIVTDTTGNPVKAFIKITGHDIDSSQIYSHPVTGDYHRMIAPGTYNLTFSAPGFFPQTISNIQAANFQTTIVNIELVPDGTPVELISFSGFVDGNDAMISWSTATELNNKGFEIERKFAENAWETVSFMPGKGTATEVTLYDYRDKNLSSGKYFYRLKQIDFDGSFSFSAEIELNKDNFDFILYQNYPNPFNPDTRIRYQVPFTEMVTLKVFDVLGEEIVTLVDQVQQAGLYEINFNAKDLTSGIYYYQIRSGDFNQTRKLILIK